MVEGGLFTTQAEFDRALQNLKSRLAEEEARVTQTYGPEAARQYGGRNAEAGRIQPSVGRRITVPDDDFEEE
jgi:hypothetical protein